MSTASARQATTPWPLPVGAAVVGGDAPARHRSARLLAEAGFLVGSQATADAAVHVMLLAHAGDTDRVRAVRAVVEAHPDACILAVMPAGAANASLRKVLLAGATGIVLDGDLERALAPTARAMLAGQLTVPTVLGRQIAPRPLSHREKEILALVVRGRTNREIADALYLAESTVKTHLSSAFRKLDARSRSDAVARITDPESGYGTAVLDIEEPVTRRLT
jgi:DNA-binding NarL/FixJ family response regulator